MTVMHKLKYPSKSWMIALLNTLLTPLKILGVGPFSTGSLTLEKMMPLAITANGLSDFGDLTFVSIYRTVREYYDFKSQVYTPLGYIMAKSELEMVLNRRLQAIEYLKRNPEISSIPTPSPIFVFGLGRSGTTFLHRLLSLDPNHRSPKLWELCFSVPDQSLTKDSSQEAFQKDRSIRQMTMQHLIDQRNQMGDDGLDLYHEIGCDLPEECLFAMANEIPLIASYVFSTLVNWTQFRASLTSKDIVRSYAWYKSILQILSFQTGDRAKGNQWVLKCPVHSFFIPELLQVFPDAKLVW